jgi:hypothetical protein
MNATSLAGASRFLVSCASEKVDVTDPSEIFTHADRMAASGEKVSIQEIFPDGSSRWIVGGPAPVPASIASAPAHVVATPDNHTVAARALEIRADHATIAERNAAPTPEERSTFKAQIVSDVAARALASDHLELSEAGFSLPQAYYAVGTLLADSGVASFAAKKDAWERAPRIGDACDSVVARVKAEDRLDVKVRVGDMTMSEDGTISRGAGKIALVPQVFGSFCNRIGMPSAGEYLRKCDPSLRAHNVNAWIERNASKEIVLRTMKGEGPRRVYAVVSDSYAECNADKIAEAMKQAMRAFPDARGHVTYDPDNGRVQIEAEFMSPIVPAHAAVGEVWRATVRAFGDDTGGGSVKGGGGVSMALCLNFTYADVNGYTFQIRHMGRMQEVVRKLREGIGQSLKQIEKLVTRWGFACEENVVEDARALALAQGETIPVPVSLAMPWLFAGIVERELVPVVGRKEEAIKRLVMAHEADASSAVRGVTSGISRASIVNAFTKYAHVEVSDPWQTDIIQKQASALLWSDKPLPAFDPSKL